MNPAAADAEAKPAKPSLKGGYWILTGTIMASSMAFIDGTALGVALPALQADLGASGAQLLWIVDAYLLTLGSLMLIGGALGDKYGRKLVFMTGIAFFSVSSLVCGLSPETNFLIAGRFIQGVGGALMIPGSLAIITASFGTENRGRAIGTWSAVTTVVTVIGPFLGGSLADAGLWRGVFLINIPLAIGALLILHLKVPESRDAERGPLDLAGAVTVALGLALLTYGFISAPQLGFSDPVIIGALAGGMALLLLNLYIEATSSHPMVPLGMFRSRNFSGANLLTLFLYGGLNVAVFFLPLNLVQVQGYSALAAGLFFLPFPIFLGGMSRWSGSLVDRIGPRLPLTIGPLVTGFGFLLMALPGLTSGPQAYFYTYLPGIAVFAAGMGLTVVPLTTTVMSALPERFAGTESGINNAVSRVAGVLSIAIIGSIALMSFSNQLETASGQIGLSPQAATELSQEASKLGEAQVPASVEPGQAAEVEASIKSSFIHMFRLVMIVCFGMAVISVITVRLLISGSVNGDEFVMRE